jgi:hypothetical protein
MMAAAKRDPILVDRLERLGGDDADCCVPQYESLARDVRSSPSFPYSLRRAKALADEHRLLALALLKRRTELCACEIQAATGLTHATVSHHMAILAHAGLVSSRREGKWLFYRLEGTERAGIP